MTELKRCPFCGGEARISELTYPMKHYTVICSNEKCYAEMGDFISNEDAIRMWNTRPNPWHTGVPTEEGLYLTTVKVDNCYAYEPVHWKNKWGFRHFDKPIVAWQKITPYEEKEK